MSSDEDVCAVCGDTKEWCTQFVSIFWAGDNWWQVNKGSE